MKRVLAFAAIVTLLTIAADASSVNGRVSFVTKRGQHPTINETLVWLEPLAAKIATRRAPVTFQMTTRGKMLLPHVMAIPVGSTVEFPNDDPISHNLFSLASNNAFDLGLYRRGAGKSHKFDTPGVVSVYCNVHPNMSAVIHVMTTPFYAFASATGDYAIPDVPAGRYRLIAWNEQGGQAESTIDVAATGAASHPVTLDSRNYRESSHTNKLGKPYQPPSSREY